MIDYISATKCLHKDSPNLSNCKWVSSNEMGIDRYQIIGQKPMNVLWNPSVSLLTIEGSIPYFAQGHNFSFDRHHYIEAIQYMQALLDVGLWDAWLNEFEYGVVFPVQGKPTDYIRNHIAGTSSRLKECINGRDNGKGKWWVSPSVDLKIYDPKANLRGKVKLIDRASIVGYNPELEYLKFEAHFNKPHLLNAGVNLSVEDLQCPDRLASLNDILVSQYKLLHPMRTLLKPTDKGELKYQELITRQLVEVLMNQGMSIQDAKKEIYRFMDGFDCLTKPDKDKRKETARKVFKGLQESEKSQWDLTEQINEALLQEL